MDDTKKERYRVAIEQVVRENNMYCIDELIRQQTDFFSAELLFSTAPDYPPVLSSREVADFYDRVQELIGDPRRARRKR